jgi:hypothetical protein
MDGAMFLQSPPALPGCARRGSLPLHEAPQRTARAHLAAPIPPCHDSAKFPAPDPTRSGVGLGRHRTSNRLKWEHIHPPRRLSCRVMRQDDASGRRYTAPIGRRVIVASDGYPYGRCFMPSVSVRPHMPTMQWLRRHPFLLVGIGSFFFFAPLLVLDLQPESSLFQGLVVLWQSLGVGPYTASNMLAHHAPDIPGWLDATLVVVLGLLPYAAADAILQRLWSRHKHTRAPQHPSSHPGTGV